MEWLFGAWVLWVSAPRIIWFAAAGIVAVTLWQGLELYRASRRERTLCERLLAAVGQLRQDYPSGRAGLRDDGFEALRKVFEDRPELRPAWNNFSAELVPQSGTNGHDHYFSEGSAANAFSEAALFGGRINWRWFAAFPGFITGLGLLFTFFAILVALADLKADPSGQIKGIQQLLEGLSGKFLSSVVALLMASVFLVVERLRLHQVEQGRQNLINALDEFVPRLTPARLLVEVKQNSAEQLDSLRSLLTDLGPKLRQGLNESIGPTLDRMVSAIEELNQFTRAAEAQRRESLTDALKLTLDRLSQDLKNTLGSLGEGFSQSLVGEAGRSFDRVLTSLEATGRLVERMNAQFEDNQSALRALVDQARDSTSRQIELGKAHVEELSGVLHQMMERLNDMTGNSVAQLNTALSDAIRQMVTAGQESSERIAKLVGNLAMHVEATSGSTLAQTKDNLNLISDQLISKVGNFSNEIAQAVGRNAQATHASVQKIFEETNQLFRQNSERTSAVLDRYQGQLERTEILGGELNRLADQMRAALPEYSAITKAFQTVAAEVRSAAQSSKEAANSVQGTASSLRAIQTQVTDVAKYSAEQVAQLLAATRETHASMTEYGRIFAQVKTQAAELLTLVDDRLKQQVATARDGYEAMSRAADELFKNAVERLGGSVGELNESLDDLQGAIDRIRGQSDGRKGA